MRKPHKVSHTTIRLAATARADTRRPDAVPRVKVADRRAVDAGLRRYLDAVERARQARDAAPTARLRSQSNAAKQLRQNDGIVSTAEQLDDGPMRQAIRRLAESSPSLPTKRSPRGAKPKAIGRDGRSLLLGAAMTPALKGRGDHAFVALARQIVRQLTIRSRAYSDEQARLVLALAEDDPLNLADRPVWIENLRNRLKRDLRLTKR